MFQLFIKLILPISHMGVLGALGQRFESYRPDIYSNRSHQYQKVSLKIRRKFRRYLWKLTKTFTQSYVMCAFSC